MERERLRYEKYIIYSTKLCSNCKALKQLLEKENVQYKNINMTTTMSAPVLQIDSKFYTTQDIIDQYKVKTLVN